MKPAAFRRVVDKAEHFGFHSYSHFVKDVVQHAGNPDALADEVTQVLWDELLSKYNRRIDRIFLGRLRRGGSLLFKWVKYSGHPEAGIYDIRMEDNQYNIRDNLYLRKHVYTLGDEEVREKIAGMVRFFVKDMLESAVDLGHGCIAGKTKGTALHTLMTLHKGYRESDDGKTWWVDGVPSKGDRRKPHRMPKFIPEGMGIGPGVEDGFFMKFSRLQFPGLGGIKALDLLTTTAVDDVSSSQNTVRNCEAKLQRARKDLEEAEKRLEQVKAAGLDPSKDFGPQVLERFKQVLAESPEVLVSMADEMPEDLREYVLEEVRRNSK